MPRRIILESVTEDGRAEILRLESGGVSLGRDAKNSIVVDSIAVSRRHAAVIEAGSQWVFKDLGSSNGSWVNGIQVNPGQIRLLRERDTLQLSDFPVVVSFENVEGELPVHENSVLVFYSDGYQREYTIAEGEVFRAGGQESHIQIDGDVSNDVQFELLCSGERLELHVAMAVSSVILNGTAAQGVVALNDRDEISLGLYKIVVNNLATADFNDGEVVTSMGSQSGSGAPPACTTTSFIVDSLAEVEDWESEASRRRSLSGRKFIFNSSEDSDEVTGTLSYGSNVSRSQAGFGMSMSQRLSSISQPEEDVSKKNAINDTLYAALGLFMLVIFGFAVFYFLYM